MKASRAGWVKIIWTEILSDWVYGLINRKNNLSAEDIFLRIISKFWFGWKKNLCQSAAGYVKGFHYYW